MAEQLVAGYECEFVEQVPEDYFCKKCKHVAREPQVTSCCTEAICKACFEVILDEKQTCPNCESNEISNNGSHKKYQPKILALEVYCTLRRRGCHWTGDLGDLEDHSAECASEEISCDVQGCGQKFPRGEKDQHMRESIPTHFSLLGATVHKQRQEMGQQMQEMGQQMQEFEQKLAGQGKEFGQKQKTLEENLEKKAQHLKERLEDFEKAFKELGEEVEKQKKTSEQSLNQTIKTVEEKEAKLNKKIDDLRLQEKMAQQSKELEKKVKQQNEALTQVMNRKIDQALQAALKQRDKELADFKSESEASINELRTTVGFLPYEIILPSYEYAKTTVIRCPPMYTHPGGYRFQLVLSLLSDESGKWKVSVIANSLKGGYDLALRFPAKFTLTVELVNQLGDHSHWVREIDCEVTREKSGWDRIGRDAQFISEDRLGVRPEENDQVQDRKLQRSVQYLKNNSLKFRITNIAIIPGPEEYCD